MQTTSFKPSPTLLIVAVLSIFAALLAQPLSRTFTNISFATGATTAVTMAKQFPNSGSIPFQAVGMGYYVTWGLEDDNWCRYQLKNEMKQTFEFLVRPCDETGFSEFTDLVMRTRGFLKEALQGAKEAFLKGLPELPPPAAP